MKPAIAMLPTALVYMTSASVLLSQGVPTSQPGLITITRDEVKTGHNAAHAAHEVGWPAAYAKAKSPYYYLALVSMTGPNEAWYVSAYASHQALGESLKMESSNATLSAELARLARVDADHINSVRQIHAAARPDLSHGTYPDIALERYWGITIFRVRPGHEQGFADAAKAYAAATKRAAPNASWRTYEVIAGLAGPTYLVFSSVRAFADFDQGMKEEMEIGKAFTAEEMAALQKFSQTGLINAETQRFRLDPAQSYVDAATKAKDPTFWSPPARR